MLRALLLSIFFQRTLENVVPETLDVFDTHVAVVSGAGTTGLAGPGQKVTEIEREINDKVDGFVRSFVETGKEGGEVSASASAASGILLRATASCTFVCGSEMSILRDSRSVLML